MCSGIFLHDFVSLTCSFVNSMLTRQPGSCFISLAAAKNCVCANQSCNLIAASWASSVRIRWMFFAIAGSVVGSSAHLDAAPLLRMRIYFNQRCFTVFGWQFNASWDIVVLTVLCFLWVGHILVSVLRWSWHIFLEPPFILFSYLY